MKRRVLLTVGNGLMGDDGAAVWLAHLVKEAPLEGWEVIEGGSAPENVLHRVRELTPQRVLVVDSAEMGLPAGEVRLIPPDQVADPFLFSTHTLPLSFLLEALREIAPQVDLLGVQPAVVAFGYPLSPAVKQAVQDIYETLKRGEEDWALLTPELLWDNLSPAIRGEP